MKTTTTALLILLAISSVHCTVHESAKDKLSYHKKHMPEKVEDVAEDVQSGFDHVKGAVEKGFDALTEEGVRHKIHNAYDAVKEGLKLTKDAKDVTVDSQKVGLEGAKDAAKEGIHVYRKHEDLEHKLEDAQQFVADEAHLSKEAFKGGLHGGLQEKGGKIIDAASDGLKHVGDTVKTVIDGKRHVQDTLEEAGDKVKSAVGLDDKEHGLGDKIKAAVGLGVAEKEGLGEKVKSAVGLEEKEHGLTDKIKAAVGLGETEKEGLKEKIKSAAGLEEKESGLADKIKAAVGLGEAEKEAKSAIHEKEPGLTDKIKAAVGLGDDHHHNHEKHDKKHADEDL